MKCNCDQITFVLKGRTGPVFWTDGHPFPGSAVVSVRGFTADGKQQTLARYADVDFTDHYITMDHQH